MSFGKVFTSFLTSNDKQSVLGTSQMVLYLALYILPKIGAISFQYSKKRHGVNLLSVKGAVIIYGWGVGF